MCLASPADHEVRAENRTAYRSAHKVKRQMLSAREPKRVPTVMCCQIPGRTASSRVRAKQRVRTGSRFAGSTKTRACAWSLPQQKDTQPGARASKTRGLARSSGTEGQGARRTQRTGEKDSRHLDLGFLGQTYSVGQLAVLLSCTQGQTCTVVGYVVRHVAASASRAGPPQAHPWADNHSQVLGQQDRKVQPRAHSAW